MYDGLKVNSNSCHSNGACGNAEKDTEATNSSKFHEKEIDTGSDGLVVDSDGCHGDGSYKVDNDSSDNDISYTNSSTENGSCSSDDDTVIYSDDSSDTIIYDTEESDVSSNYIRTGNITLFYTNCDSVLNKRDELDLEIERYKPDIIVLTEIFPKTTNSNDIYQSELKIDGYDIIMNQSADKRRGVCLYVNESFRYENCKILNDSLFVESCWCVVKLESGEQLLIGGVYRSPSSDSRNSRHLNDLITMAISLKYDYNVIVGDFNYPDISWSEMTTTHNQDHVEFHFLECVKDNFLSQCIHNPTRYRDGQRANTLDLLLTDKEEVVQKVTYSANLGASDHICFTVDLDCNSPELVTRVERKNFHKGDYESIRSELEQVEWECMQNMNVQQSWDFFISQINESVDKHVPVSKPRAGKKKKKWVNQKTLGSIKKKHKTWQKYIHTLDSGDYRTYCAARNECTKETRKAKKLYESSIIESINSDSKGFWSYVRERTKCRSGIPGLKNEQGHIVQDDKCKADLLNDFFASVFIEEPSGTLPVFDIRYSGTPVTDIVADIEKTAKSIKTINISKSMGPDEMHPRLLNETADIITRPLCDIFNKTFNEGKLPSVWKQANVSALFKNKGDKTKATNYRPVSLTCLPCRLCEKSVRETIMAHMNENDLFSDCQYGFRNKRSTVLQLLDVLDDWTKFFDNSKQIDTIYLDIKKAFDTVPHNRLILKLRGYGFGGKLVQWIEDFLSERQQRVVLNGAASEWKSVTSGIPQGSVLGPVLFVIYINDIPDSIESFCKIFADDTKIYSSVSNTNDQDIMQSDLLKLCEWSRQWLLEFSIQKCKTIQFGNVKYPANYHLLDSSNNSCDLPNDTQEKDLGIIFESTLKFDKHIESVVNRANRLLGMIKRTFSSLNSRLFLILYKSLIRSILDYGGSVWSPSTKKNIQLIENVQRRATRLVPELRGMTYQERLTELNLPTLLYRRQRYDLIQVFKMIHGFESCTVDKFFEFNDNPTRGHIFKIMKPRCNKSLRQNSFSVRVIDMWNGLSEDTVCAKSVLSFKTKLDREWKSKRFVLDNIYRPYQC